MALFVFAPKPVLAMHIAEGILPAGWAIGWYAVAIPFLIIGVRMISKKTQQNRKLIPLLGLAGAAVFLISVFPVPVPVAGTTSHPAGTPLAAILLGPFIAAVLGAIALLFQALFLSHGGLSTWGANILSMAVVGSFVGFGVFFVLRKTGVSLMPAAFAAGVLGDWATYAMTSFELASALAAPGGFWQMWGSLVAAFAPTQLPLGFLEGLFTAGVVGAIQQRRPDLLAGGLLARKQTAEEAIR
ncbi:energy-coupling factor ABC transporter permease [Dehalogenimonas formicexedens]|uniref:energy-coupling factor ABC transporter permease n=1 Tax=Dehalogenimonas formicexedens TaxID=1839801 RepID=UPI001CEF70E3|nr:energy-coupling factor ABC transporter permease [Dehalogenimonas formicexedens]